MGSDFTDDVLGIDPPDTPNASEFPTRAPVEFTYEPAVRDYAQEYKDTLEAQIEMAPEVFRSNLIYQPLYAALNYGIQEAFLPRYAELGQQITSGSREQDMQDLVTLAPKVTEAYRQANPEAAALLDELNKQAGAELAGGGALSPDEVRAVEQTSRAAYNDRGMVMSDPAIFSEVMNLDAAKRARLNESRAFASNVLGLNKSIYGDPSSVVLGRASSNLGFSGIPSPTSSNAYDVFNPESQYASSLYSGNQTSVNNANAATANANSDYFSLLYGAEMDAENTQANNSAAIFGAGINAAGQILGGAVGG